MLKTYTLMKCDKVQPNIWILRGRHNIGFGVIGTVAALVENGLIECDNGQPVFHDRYVYSFLDSVRTSCVYSSFEDALKNACLDHRINHLEGLPPVVLGYGVVDE